MVISGHGFGKEQKKRLNERERVIGKPIDIKDLQSVSRG